MARVSPWASATVRTRSAAFQSGAGDASPAGSPVSTRRSGFRFGQAPSNGSRLTLV